MISGTIKVSLMKLCTVILLLKAYQNIYSIYCCLTFVYIYIYIINLCIFIYIYIYLFICTFVYICCLTSAPAYGVYASQLIRYARCCSNYSDFLLRHRALVTRLLSQGYKVNRLSNTFKKFYGRHTDLVGQYKKNVCQMFADSIS